MDAASISAVLLPPNKSENWRVQFNGVDDRTRSKVRVAVRTAPNSARPFLQGDFESWMLVEFWTDRAQSIASCVNHFEKIVGIAIGGERPAE